MHAWSYIVRFLTDLALLGEKMKKDETFQFIRWINLILGIMNIYYYMLGAGPIILSIAVLNIGAWVFTRKV
tara:strand:- start:716 stop:928 length:213 start_codon:yes stop_codon:yes gene_type:complete